MNTSDMFFLASGVCAVVAVGVGGWALGVWHRRLAVSRAFTELDADIIRDRFAYPDLKDKADELYAKAWSAHEAGELVGALWDEWAEAERYRANCELRLRAADLDPAEILLGEVA